MPRNQANQPHPTLPHALGRVPTLRGTGPIRHARRFTQEAVSEYWAGVAGKAPLARPPLPLHRDLSDEQRERARAFGREQAAAAPDVAAYRLSSLYTSLLPPDYRAKHGVFFTPPSLADRLLDLAEAEGVDWGRHSILDPAAGGGALLAPVATRMLHALRRKRRGSGAILEHVERRLAGVELDPFSAWLSHVFLEVALWPVIHRADRRLNPVISVGDSIGLPDRWRGGFDAVVGNPPYGRVGLSAEVRGRYARSLFGHANLYGVFTDLAVRLAAPDGLVAFVTPTSFLGGQYFQRLRELLVREAPLVAIDFVADRADVFEDVLQETALAAYRCGARSPAPRVNLLHPRGLDVECAVRPLGRSKLPESGGAPWILPRAPHQRKAAKAAARLPHRLRDLGYEVSTGPLVWNRHRDQLRDQPGPDRLPLVWAEAVVGPGRFTFKALRRNHKPYFQLRGGQDHLVIRAPCVLLQRTTSKEQGRRLVAAVMPASFIHQFGGAVVENHLNVVRPISGVPEIDLEALCALLNSGLTDDIFRCVSGSVAVSAYELQSLPLPSPQALKRFAKVAAGKGAQSTTTEEALRAAYGIG